MLYAYLTLLIYSYFRGLRGCYRIFKSLNYISTKHKVFKKNQVDNFNHSFHIIIPVLREQDIILETIKHFSKLAGNYNVYFVTTAREDFDKKNNPHIYEKYRKIPTTREVIQRYLNQHPELAPRIKLLNYPYRKERVAHQLNYALKKIKKMTKNNDYVIFYNADSRIHRNVLKLYQAIIMENAGCLVIQQSAVFLANFNKLNSFLKSIALLQTRWTLAHEIPRILRTNGIMAFTEGAHVVSHGLCIQYGFVQKLGGFPIKYLNEDLPLGYFIRLYGAKIYLLKNLENADTPITVKSMFNQYRTWFYGISYYPQYIYDAIHQKSINKPLAVIWGLKYILRGIIWLNLSLCWLLIFALPIFLGMPYLEILSMISFLIYASLSFYIIYFKLGNSYKIDKNVMALILTPVTYLTHSLGPILACYDIIYSQIGGPIYKNKTER